MSDCLYVVKVIVADSFDKSGDRVAREGEAFFVGEISTRGMLPLVSVLTPAVDADDTTFPLNALLVDGPFGQKVSRVLMSHGSLIPDLVFKGCELIPATRLVVRRLTGPRAPEDPQADGAPPSLSLRLTSLEAENKELSRRLDAVNKRCDAHEDSLSDYTARLWAMEEGHKRAVERVAALEGALSSLGKKISTQNLTFGASEPQRDARTESGVTLAMVEKLMNEHAEKLDKHFDEIMISKGRLNSLTDRVEKLEETLDELSTSDNFAKVADASLRQEIKKLGAMYEDLDRRTPTAETIQRVDERMNAMEKRLSELEGRARAPTKSDEITDTDVIFWAMDNEGKLATAVFSALYERKMGGKHEDHALE